MRLRFLLGAGLAAGLVLWASFYLKSRPSGALRNSPREPAGEAGPVTGAPPAPAAVPGHEPAIPPAIASQEVRQKFIEEQVERLRELAMNDDPAALNEILLALTSPEQEIREAAVEGAKQFGSTNAIPALLAAADAVTDLKERVALLEAVEFLSLPPATFDSKPALLTPEQAQAEEERRALRRLRRQAREAELSGVPPEPSALPADPSTSQ